MNIPDLVFHGYLVLDVLSFNVWKNKIARYFPVWTTNYHVPEVETNIILPTNCIFLFCIRAFYVSLYFIRWLFIEKRFS